MLDSLLKGIMDTTAIMKCKGTKYCLDSCVMFMNSHCKDCSPTGEDIGWKYIFTYGYIADVYGKGNQRKIVNRDTRRTIAIYTISKRLRERVEQLTRHNLLSQATTDKVFDDQME